jgi:hypothetical protein
MTRSGFLTNATAAKTAGGESCALSPDRVAADFEHRGQLDQLGLVLVGMVLAEQQFCSGGQLGANPCSRAAPIAPISPG